MAAKQVNDKACSRQKNHPGRRTTKQMLPAGPECA